MGEGIEQRPFEITQTDAELIIATQGHIPEEYLPQAVGRFASQTFIEKYRVIDNICLDILDSDKREEGLLFDYFRDSDNLNVFFNTSEEILKHKVAQNEKSKKIYLMSLFEIKKIIKYLLEIVFIIENEDIKGLEDFGGADESVEPEDKEKNKVYNHLAKMLLEKVEKRINEITKK